MSDALHQWIASHSTGRQPYQHPTCYSAQIWSDYRRYTQLHDAKIDMGSFVDLFWSRLDNDRIKVFKALEQAFSTPRDGRERHIKSLINDAGLFRRSHHSIRSLTRKYFSA